MRQSVYPRRPYASAAEVHTGDVVRLCDGAAHECSDREPPGFSDAIVVDLIVDALTGAVTVEVARPHAGLLMDGTVEQRVERYRVDMDPFLAHYQLLTTGHAGKRDNRVRPMSPYYSVQIPWSDTPTQWHPTEHSGPFSVLSRGAFATQELAEQWAREHLGNTLFHVRRTDPMADDGGEFAAHTGKTVEQARASEQDLSALARERRALDIAREQLNQRVRAASGGRPHHQACRLGGLSTGMGADVSGSPCWCGHDGWSDGARDGRKS